MTDPSEIDTSERHERAKERVILFTNLARVHKLVETRITNSPDGGVEINYLQDGHLARIDMAKDGKVYAIFWARGQTLHGIPIGPRGDVYEFSEEMMPALIHRIQNFLESGRDC